MDDKFQRLRKYAEQIVSKQPRSAQLLGENEIENVVHELCVHQAELEIQNEELRKAQMDLETERVRYEDLFDFAPVGYFTTDRLDRILEVNLVAAGMMGVERKHMYKKPLSLYLTPDSTEIFHHHKNAVFKTGGRHVSEMTLKTKGCEPMFVHVESEPVNNPAGTPVGMRTTITDISHRKRLEERLEIATRETKTLLAETLHRTKNNLSIILCLLMLQAENMGNEDAKNALRETANRIRSLSIVQEMLFRSENPTRIDLDGYIQDLAHTVFTSFKGDLGITLKLDLDSRNTSSETAVYCGLLLNEMMTNSMKYAFPDGRAGVFHILLRSGETGEIEIRAGDNGVGMPDGFDLKNGTLGFQLIDTFVKQLRGVMEVRTDRGTEFVIRFNPDLKRVKGEG